MFRIATSCWWFEPFIIIKWPFSSLVTPFALVFSYLSQMIILYSAFFISVFLRTGYLSHLFTFSLKTHFIEEQFTFHNIMFRCTFWCILISIYTHITIITRYKTFLSLPKLFSYPLKNNSFVRLNSHAHTMYPFKVTIRI